MQLRSLDLTFSYLRSNKSKKLPHELTAIFLLCYRNVLSLVPISAGVLPLTSLGLTTIVTHPGMNLKRAILCPQHPEFMYATNILYFKT